MYMVTLTGFNMSIHQCQGKTAFAILGMTFNKSCNCSHTDVKHASKCCSNKKIVIEKNTKDNFFQKDNIIVKAASLGFNPAVADFKFDFSGESNHNAHFYNVKAPPDLHSKPLFLLHRVILI